MNVPTKFGAYYYREQLSPQGKTFYDCIEGQLRSKNYSGRTTVKIIDSETAAADCFAAYKAVKDDHPEYFYLGFQSEFTSHCSTGTLVYPILYKKDIIERMDVQLSKSLCKLVQGTASLRLTEKEILVYERIAGKLRYKNNNDVSDHSVVGPVLLSQGVCEGHNALLMMAFRRIGIPCIKAYGKTSSGGWHCWTIAWIYGNPVHCDVTWEDNLSYDYFNLSDKQISKDHFQFTSEGFPKCTCEEYDYFSLRGLRAKSFRHLVELIRSKLSYNGAPLVLRFGYQPEGGDYFRETRKAIREARIKGEYQLSFNPSNKNMKAQSSRR